MDGSWVDWKGIVDEEQSDWSPVHAGNTNTKPKEREARPGHGVRFPIN